MGYLNFLLKFVEPHPSEAALYQRFAGIGIAAGRVWRPEDTPADVLSAIEAGVKRGLAEIDEQASHTTSSLGIFGSREQLGDDYLTRAVAAQMGIYGQINTLIVINGQQSRSATMSRSSSRPPPVTRAARSAPQRDRKHGGSWRARIARATGLRGLPPRQRRASRRSASMDLSRSRPKCHPSSWL